MPALKKYTREELIGICERASVPQNKWANRDSASAQKHVGECWALLRAGCSFRVMSKKSDDPCITNGVTIWVKITFDGFGYFEGGTKEKETFYLPTPERLAQNKGDDWY